MDSSSLLEAKVVLVVDDDDVDVLDTVEEMLEMCLVCRAHDYDTAKQYLMSYNFDIVILDIMVAHEKGEPTWKLLFQMLGDYFDNRFGPRWKDEHEAFWNEFEKTYDNRQGHPAAAAA